VAEPTAPAPVMAPVMRSATPFVSGAVLFDPAAMTAASAPVARRGVLATGPASHARTGRVQTGFRAGPAAGYYIDAGTDWHYVEASETDRQGERFWTGFWCGPAQAIHMFGRTPIAACVTPLAPGVWRVFPAPEAPSWLVGWPPPTMVNALTDAFQVVDHPTDVIGPFEVDIVVRDFNDRRIRLEARGRPGEQSVAFWRGEFSWTDGHAVVPLWTHRLTLGREGSAISAVLAEGDGTALPPTTAL
jgi:hypothetical protein